MKSISEFIKESVEWVGSGWEPSCCYQLIENHYADKLTSENIKDHLDNLINNHKWHKSKWEWVKKEPELDSESDIENWVTKELKPESNSSYENYDLEKFEQLAKKIYDSFVNNHGDGPHDWVKDKEGKVIKLEDWLNLPCDYDKLGWRSENPRTWKERIEEDWEKLQKNKESSKKWLIDYAKSYLKNTIDISENTIRNIKLDDQITFGSIAFGSGRMTRSKEGYLKISEETKEGKNLILQYTDKKEEALELKTVGDLLDLIFKYKETKVETPAGVLNTRWANSINVKFDPNLKEGQLGIIRFRS